MSMPAQHAIAAALSAAAFLLSPAVRADDKPVTARALIAPTLGQTLFTPDVPVTRTALRYEVGVGSRMAGFEGEAVFGFTHFLSERGDNTENVVLGDLLVGGSYRLGQWGPLTLMPRVDVILPASKYSRDLSLLLASHVGFDGRVTAGPVSLIVRTSLRRDVHDSAQPPPFDGRLTDFRDAEPGPFGFRTAGSRLIGREDPTRAAFRAPVGVVVLALPNTAWGTHVGIDIEGDIAAGFYADLGFGWTHTWSYKLDAPANVVRSPTQPERLQVNTNTGTLGAGWRKPVGVVELGARLGLSTTGNSRTADEARSRFPWWNFEDGSTDDSVLDLRLSARY